MSSTFKSSKLLCCNAFKSFVFIHLIGPLSLLYMSGLSCNYTSSFILARWSNYTLMSIKQYRRKAGMTGLGNMPLYIKCLDQASLSKITNHNMISLILSRKKINDVLIWHKSQRILIFH